MVWKSRRDESLTINQMSLDMSLQDTSGVLNVNLKQEMLKIRVLEKQFTLLGNQRTFGKLAG